MDNRPSRIVRTVQGGVEVERKRWEDLPGAAAADKVDSTPPVGLFRPQPEETQDAST